MPGEERMRVKLHLLSLLSVLIEVSILRKPNFLSVSRLKRTFFFCVAMCDVSISLASSEFAANG